MSKISGLWKGEKRQIRREDLLQARQLLGDISPSSVPSFLEKIKYAQWLFP